MNTLEACFLQFGFSKSDAEQIALSFTEKKLLKGDYFVKEGKTSKELGFVENGFLQYFVVLEGEEKTTYTVSENNFVVSLVSFLKNVPSKENIRALIDTVVWVITSSRLKALQNDLRAFKLFYIDLLEWQICCIDESRLDAIMLNAQERYEKMLAKEPVLIQQIPLQYQLRMVQ